MNEKGGIGLILVLTVAVVTFVVAATVQFRSNHHSQEVLLNATKSRLDQALYSALENLQSQISVPAVSNTKGLVSGDFLGLDPTGAILGTSNSFGDIPLRDNLAWPSFQQRVALVASASAFGEFRFIISVTNGARSVRAEGRVASPVPENAMLTIENWDVTPPGEGETTSLGFDPISVLALSPPPAPLPLSPYNVFPRIDTRVFAQQPYGEIIDFTKTHDAAPCVRNAFLRSALISNIGVNDFDLTGDENPSEGYATYLQSSECGNGPEIVDKHVRSNPIIGGYQVGSMTGSSNDTTKKVLEDNPSYHHGSASRKQAYLRMMETFRQVALAYASNPSNPSCSIPGVRVTIFDGDKPGHEAPASLDCEGYAKGKENIFIFRGTNTITGPSPLYGGKCHLIFDGTEDDGITPGLSHTTITGDVAIIGNVIVHDGPGAITRVDFQNPSIYVQKIAGMAYFFNENPESALKISMPQVNFYYNADVAQYYGLSRLTQLAAKATCTNTTRKMNLSEKPILLQLTSIVHQ